MADGSIHEEAHYSAFISYSHRDAAFARRLHRRLETYRLPRRRAGRQPDGRGASRRLRPLFLDREEFTAEPDLTEAVRAAIVQSSHLIVVCSPAAAVSEWVNLEIRLFRDLNGEHGILAAVCRGEPEAVIPPAMTEGRTAGGPRAHAPLAADFRREGDGDHLALLKLVAPLAGFGLDELVQRDAQRRVRRMGAIGAGAVAGMGVAGVLAFAAIESRIAAEHERTRSQGVVDYMLTDLRGKLKGVGRLDALDAVNKGAMGYYRGQNLATLPTPALIERAKLLQAVGEDDEKKGDYAGARARFDEASRITDAIYKAHPNDPAVIYAQAQSAYWNGFICWRMGDDAGALKGFQNYAILARRLPSSPNRDTDYQLESANADSDLGAFVLRQSIDVHRAQALFAAAQKIFEAAGRAKPSDHDVQVSIADGHAWLADTRRLGNDYAGALAERVKQRETLELLIARDPRDFEARTALLGNMLALARIAAARDDLASAIRQLKEAHSAAVALYAADPDNRDIKLQARAIALFEARTWLSMSPSNRPSKAAIDAVIGDCDTSNPASKEEELDLFCNTLKARRLQEDGQTDAAETLLNDVRKSQSATGPALTERWRLDLRQETNLVRGR